MIDSIRAEIIFGEPQAKDAFSAGGHDRSAQALADSLDKIIKHGQSTGKHGGSIGLEGSWGSGKTTVIQIAEAKLEKLQGDTDFLVMTFDMWAHQSDEFRRAFLEEFLNFLEANQVKKFDIKIEDERNAIRNRKKHVTDAVERKYTVVGALIILLLPFLPLLYAWLQPTSFVNQNKLGNAPYVWMWIGISVVLASVILGVVSYFRIDKTKRANTKRWRDKFALGVSRFLMISNKVDSQTTTQWIRDEDPTTVEFQEVFRKLLAKVQQGNRRLVFVLDNVDRLPTEMVQKAWSDMRALFAARSGKPEETVLAVIPYDRYHVSQGLGSKREAPKEPAAQPLPAEKAPPKLPAPEHDVFEKTFDRIIRVSPPVPSDWRQYLTERLSQAFGKQVDDERHERLYRLLRHWFVETNQHPTPRRIVSFVNDISALRGQWGDAIPVESVALYVLHREQIDRNHSALTDPGVVGGRYISIAGQEEWRKHLASLSFNVGLDFANQVYLGQPIAAALTATTGKELQELSDIRGFWQIFQEKLTEAMTEWAESKNSASLAQAAINVSGLQLPQDQKRSVWQDFADGVRRLPDLELSQVEELTGLFKIVEAQPAVDASGIANALRVKFETSSDPEDSVDQQSNGERWVRMLRRLQQSVAITNAVGAQDFWTQAQIRPTADFAIGVAGACRKDGLPFADLDIQVDPEALEEATSRLIDPDTSFYAYVLPILFPLIGYVPRSHMPLIGAKLQETGQDSPQHTAVLRSAVLFYARDPAALKDTFGPLAKTGGLAWHAMNAEEARCRADAFFFSVVFSGSALGSIRSSQNPEVVAWYSALFANSEMDEDLRIGVAESIGETGSFMRWLDIAIADASSHENLKNIVRAVDEGQATISDPRHFFEKLEQFSDMLGTEKTLAVLTAASDSEGLEAAATEFAPRVPTDLLNAMANAGGSESIRATLSGIDRFLTDIPTANWETHLADPTSHELRVLIARAEHGFTLPPATIVPAIAAAAIEMLEGKFEPSKTPGRYGAVLDALPARGLPQAASMLMTKLEKADVSQEGVEAFVQHLAPLASKLKIEQTKEAANLAVTKLIWFLVQSDADAATAYLRAQAATVRKSLEMADPEVRQSVEGEVADMDADAEWPTELRKLLKLPKPQKKSKESEKQD